MSFPQLLRRSAFAQHDPLIIRIYTSTPSAISQTGDWGLKYPIHRPKGPKYIKVSNLDSGAAVGADWRSGEKEARFTEAWGTGKVRWQRVDDASRNLRKAPSHYVALTEEEVFEEEPDRLLPDLEAMTPGEFERYLDTIRSERKEFLKHRLGGVKDAAGWRAEEGDLTLINLATSGNATDACGTNMQASLVKTELKRPHSKTLHSQPHTNGGLYYSQRIPSYTSSNLSYVDPRTTIPGRALNKKDRDQNRRDGVRTNIFSSDNNTPYVVSVGGVTGSARPHLNEQSVTETDYTRTHPERGIGRFQIQSAKLSSLPTVINLQASEIASRYGNYPISKAKRATPLDTFEFNIELDLANPGEELGKGMRALEPGSREWVGREPGRVPNREDALALGGLKTGRTKGATLSGLQYHERRAAEKEADNRHAGRIGGVIELISGRPKAPRWN